MVVLEAVNDRTTGSGVAPRATCGAPRSTNVVATTGAVTAIASFDSALERNMGYLDSYRRLFPAMCQSRNCNSPGLCGCPEWHFWLRQCRLARIPRNKVQIGRASCRGRV